MKITVNFFTPRREEFYECRICTEKIHMTHEGLQPPDPATFDPDSVDWYDGNGEIQAENMCFRRAEVSSAPKIWTYRGVLIKHDHKPARLEGPTFEFEGYVQVTYGNLEHDGMTIAMPNDDGDYVLVLTPEEAEEFLRSDSQPYFEGEHHSDFAVSVED